MQHFLGSIKYDGKLVRDGVLDLQSASDALGGFDEALRYFLAAENPTLGAIDIPIPVRIRKGSWEALIPNSVGSWIIAAAGLGATAYISAAAKKLAENDFKDGHIHPSSSAGKNGRLARILL